MAALGTWPLRRVLMLIGIWVAINVIFLMVQAAWEARRNAAAWSAAGLGAIGLNIALFLLITFVPPALLLLFWALARR